MFPQIAKNISRICAFVALSALLPNLTFADREDRRGDRDGEGHRYGWTEKAEGERGGEHRSDLPTVPESDPTHVLIPLMGIGFIVAASRLFRSRKALAKD
jgi:hypothetical protein